MRHQRLVLLIGRAWPAVRSLAASGHAPSAVGPLLAGNHDAQCLITLANGWRAVCASNARSWASAAQAEAAVDFAHSTPTMGHQQQQQQSHQQQQQDNHPDAANGAASTSSSDRSASSNGSGGRQQGGSNGSRQHQRQDRRRQPDEWRRGNRQRYRQVELSGSLADNLTAQMQRKVLRSEPEYHDAVGLFERFLQQGEEEGFKETGMTNWLPREYLPDRAAIQLYLKALHGANKLSLKAVGRCADLEEVVLPERHPSRETMTYLMSLHLAQENYQRVLELYNHLKSWGETPLFSQYRFAAEAAVRVRDYELADSLLTELLEGSRKGEVLLGKQEQRTHLVPLYKQLVQHHSIQGTFDEGVHRWLSVLLDLPDVPLDVGLIMVVIRQALGRARLDWVAAMLNLLEDYHSIELERHQREGGERAPLPVVYEEELAVKIMHAAAHRNNLPLAERVFALLTRSLEQQSRMQQQPAQRQGQQQGQQGQQQGQQQAQRQQQQERQEQQEQSREQQRQQQHKQQHRKPSLDALIALCEAHVMAGSYGRAFELVEQLQASTRDKGRRDVFRGLHVFAEQLNSEQKLAAAWTTLSARQQQQQKSKSVVSMNIILRAMARLPGPNAVERTITLLDSYPALGIAPDADSYNCIMEACMLSAKVAPIQSLMAFMQTKGLSPNATSWELLLKAATAASDWPTIASTLEQMKQQKAAVHKVSVLSDALKASRATKGVTVAEKPLVEALLDQGADHVPRQLGLLIDDTRFERDFASLDKQLQEQHRRRQQQRQWGEQQRRGEGRQGQQQWRDGERFGRSSSSSSGSSSDRGWQGGRDSTGSSSRSSSSGEDRGSDDSRVSQWHWSSRSRDSSSAGEAGGRASTAASAEWQPEQPAMPSKASSLRLRLMQKPSSAGRDNDSGSQQAGSATSSSGWRWDSLDSSTTASNDSGASATQDAAAGAGATAVAET